MRIFNQGTGDNSGSFMRLGEVTSIDFANVKVRVTFDDEDGMTSNWLPVMQRNTIANQDYWLPDIGEDVVCVFFKEGAEDGFVLGSIYAGDVKPPENNGDKRTVVFKDGTRVSYDRAQHHLDIAIEETTLHADRSKVNVQAPDEISATSKKITVSGSESVSVSGSQSVDIASGTKIALSAPTITLTISGTTMTFNGSSAELTSQNMKFKGNVTIEGDLSVTGNISANGNITASGQISGSNI